MLRSAAAGLVIVVAVVPARADAPCVAGIDHVTGDSGKLVVCADGATCFSFADKAAKPVAYKPPPEAPPPAAIRHDAAGKAIACAGATCKPIGPKLAAAAKAATNISVTTDVTAVVLDVDLWDVAADATVVIAKPPKPPMDTPVPYAAGKIIVATWRNCADDYNCPDPIATIVDVHGKQIGKPFPDGRLAIVDAHHAAMVGDGRKLTAFDTDTGAQLGTIPLIPNVALTGLAIGRVDDGVLGVAWNANSTAWTIAAVTITAGKPPALAWSRKLDVCPP
jgi:hypothetical protein|nr:hypothetical protein [Kofleriaceae bacterium]